MKQEINNKEQEIRNEALGKPNPFIPNRLPRRLLKSAPRKDDVRTEGKGFEDCGFAAIFKPFIYKLHRHCERSEAIYSDTQFVENRLCSKGYPPHPAGRKQMTNGY